MSDLKAQAIDMYLKQGLRKDHVASALGVPRQQVREWLQGIVKGYVEDRPVPPETELLKDKIKSLETLIASNKRDTLTEHYVREKIFGLSNEPTNPPSWMVEEDDFDGWSAVPTIFASDWHFGEVVDASEIGGVNEFDMQVAESRAQKLIETSINLLNLAGGEYPGVVFALGGDMVTGDIHDELKQTNDSPTLPVVLRLYEVLIWCIKQLADKYGNVFVPCVSGNHGRTTKKIQAKQFNYMNYDWLVYNLLERYFRSDSRVKFHIPNGTDALFKIYNTTYLLTHGNQFRGGDGLIGVLGPIVRGDHKKRGRNGQIDMSYDVLLLGHFHQLLQMQRIIVNGSLKGYDEYAYTNNFGYEQPRQALWLTNKHHGIIMSMPVNLGEDMEFSESSHWVTWKP